MSELKHVTPGERVPTPSASVHNAMIDAAVDYRNRRISNPGNVKQAFQQTGIVLVKNASGEDRERFDVLGLDRPIITPDDNLVEFKNHVTFRGVMPDIEEHRGKFCILLEPLAIGETGKAVVSGVTQARVYINRETDGYADVVTDDATRLESGDSGAQILWKHDGLSQQWATIRLEPPGRLIRFELLTELLPGQTATANPLLPTGGVYLPNTDEEITVSDVLGKYWGRARNPGYWPGARGYAWQFTDSDVCEILQCQSIAQSIEFTLTEDMATGSAECTVDDYHRGLDPATYQNPLEVYDPQAAFPLAIAGAKGKASLDLDSQEYRITYCQQMADTILCTVSATGSLGTIPISDFEVMGPIDGVDPAGTAYDLLNGIHNLFGDDYTTLQKIEAAWNRDRSRWDVSEIRRDGGGVAKHIEFYLYPDGISGGSAAAMVDRYYQGSSPGSSVTVYDPQNRFPLALKWANGKAVYNDVLGQYVITECQQMATLIRCRVDQYVEVFETTNSIQCSIRPEQVLVPHGAQSPAGTIYDPAALGVANRSASIYQAARCYRMRPMHEFLAVWDASDAKTPKGGWIVVESVNTTIQHAKATADCCFASPRTMAVACVRTGPEGNVLSPETHITVNLPRRRISGQDFDPDIYEGDIIQIAYDSDYHAWYCTTPYLNSAIGDIKMCRDGGRIPVGWTRCNGVTVDGYTPRDLRGRYLMGLDDVGNGPHGEADGTGVGNTGGYQWHGHYHCVPHAMLESINNHPNHRTADVGAAAGDATDVTVVSEVEHSPDTPTDNRGPFLVAFPIERYK